MRILVAMSGGVDSSVAACLLKEQGHDVIGVRFSLWIDPLAPPTATLLPTKCCAAQSVSRAHAVAKKLGIPLITLDLRRSFKRSVVDPYLRDSETGLTPNPCVVCNRVFKFAHLLALANKLKCDAIATGHYARIKRRTMNGKSYSALLEAKDTSKDQSYFLSRLTQKELRRTLLPLGNLTKQKVFRLAKKHDIPLERSTYRESQDLCFFPEKSPDAFLHRYLKSKPGPIVLVDGTVVGTHAGLPFYTIGQRRGLKVGGRKKPLRVLRKEQKINTIILAEDRSLFNSTVQIKNLSFTGISFSSRQRIPLSARIRARGKKARGKLILHGQRGVFRFDHPMEAPTPGQTLVLYRGQEIVGSATITTPPRAHLSLLQRAK